MASVLSQAEMNDSSKFIHENIYKHTGIANAVWFGHYDGTIAACYVRINKSSHHKITADVKGKWEDDILWTLTCHGYILNGFTGEKEEIVNGKEVVTYSFGVNDASQRQIRLGKRGW